MTFQIAGDKVWCARCGEPLASPSWRDKAAHTCSRRRAEYDTALVYADAAQTRCETSETPSFARVFAQNWARLGTIQDEPPGEETPDGSERQSHSTHEWKMTSDG